MNQCVRKSSNERARKLNYAVQDAVLNWNIAGRQRGGQLAVAMRIEKLLIHREQFCSCALEVVARTPLAPQSENPDCTPGQEILLAISKIEYICQYSSAENQFKTIKCYCILFCASSEAFISVCKEYALD